MGLIILGVIIGFASGWIMLRVLINYKLKTMLGSIANSPVPQQETKVIDIDLIRIKDRVYAYDRKDDSFLGYGNTKDEMVEYLRKKYPNTSFMAKPTNVKEVDFNDTV
jgi:hypothetical protein